MALPDSTELHLKHKSPMNQRLVGPALPPGLNLNRQNQVGSCLPDDECTSTVDLQTPSSNISIREHVKKEEENDYFGPALPPHLKERKLCLKEHDDSENDHGLVDEDKEETFGPLPPGFKCNTEAEIALEERALQLKLDKFQESDSSCPVREEWMTELPEVRIANFGTSRFRAKEAPDMSKRTSWTDMPGSTKTSNDEINLQEEAAKNELVNRDLQQQKLSSKHKRKDSTSLLEQHQKRLKEQRDFNKSTERKPFNRETDLQVNRFDDAQKAAVLKKAQLLDDRFSKGATKYL